MTGKKVFFSFALLYCIVVDLLLMRRSFEEGDMKYETRVRTREKKIYPFVTGDSSKLAAKEVATNDTLAVTNSVTVRKTSIAKEISTIIENEEHRQEKIAQLQQKEFTRMLAFEAKTKEIMVCKQPV
jgi:hypothetical protein